MAGRRHCRPGSAPAILWRRARVRLCLARALLTPGSQLADSLIQRISATEGSAAFVKKKEQKGCFFASFEIAQVVPLETDQFCRVQRLLMSRRPACRVGALISVP